MGKLQTRRGNKANLPNPLDNGEFGWASDTKQLYMGNGVANQNTFIGGAPAAADYKIYLATTALGGTALSGGATGLKLENGVTTATTANKLVNGNATFTAALVGKTIYNTTDNTWAKVTALDSATQLSISVDIMASGESYDIADAVDSISDAYSLIPASYGVNITLAVSTGTHTYAGAVTLGGKSAAGAVALTVQGSTTIIESTTTTTLTWGDIITINNVSFSDPIITNGTLTTTNVSFLGNLTTNGISTLTTSNITGNLVANANITLNNSDIGGTLTANSDFTNTTDITVTGAATIKGTATLATAIFSNNLTTNGNCTNTTSLNISGNWVSAGLSTVVDVSVGGNLTISNTFNCTTDLDVTGDITTTAAATVAGTVTCANITTSVGVFAQTGSLNVTTNATFNANAVIAAVTIGGNLISNGALTQTTSLNVTGNITTSGESSVDTVTVGGNLRTNAGFTQTTSMSITGTWYSYGTSIAANLTQTGTSDFSGPVTLTGTNVFNGEVHIRNPFTASGTTFYKRVFEYFGASIDWTTCVTSGDDGFIITKSTSIANIFRTSSNVVFQSDPGSYINISSTVTKGYTLYVATSTYGGDDAVADGFLITQGSATSTTANKLVDSTANFNTTDHLNKTLYNSTDDTWAKITAIDSTTQVSISADIMASGESYKVGNAFSTIQRAINQIPGAVNCNTTMKVSDGTYAESLTFQGKWFTGIYSIVLQGMLTLQETVTSATVAAGTGVTHGTVTKTGAFTGNVYANMLAYFVADNAYRLIDSHTNDVLTLVGTAPSSTTQDVRVYSWGTIVQPSGTAVNIKANQSGIYLTDMRLDTSGTGYGLLSASGEVSPTRCRFDSQYRVGNGTFSVMDMCYISGDKSGEQISFRGIAGLGDTWYSKIETTGSGLMCRIDEMSRITFALACVLDGKGMGGTGIYVARNSFVHTYSSAGAGFVKIRNFSTGINAELGGTCSNTADNVYSGNTTNELAVAASYAYID